MPVHHDKEVALFLLICTIALIFAELLTQHSRSRLRWWVLGIVWTVIVCLLFWVMGVG